jgi:glycine hydroxymethyltransferase
VAEFQEIGKLIVEVVDAAAKNEAGDAQVEQSVARRVAELCARFPIYS